MKDDRGLSSYLLAMRTQSRWGIYSKKIGGINMLVEMEAIGPVVTQNDVDAIEFELEIKIPMSYRDFIIKFNGGEPVEKLINFNTKDSSMGSDYVASFSAYYVIHKSSDGLCCFFYFIVCLKVCEQCLNTTCLQ